MTQTIPARVETWNCAQCDAECSRPATKGQRPKWCSQRCADLGKKGRKGTCRQCGKTYRGHGATYCSQGCSNASRRRPPAEPKAPVDLRSPARRAYEDGDGGQLIAELRAASTINADGCWIWPRLRSDGYPVARWGGRYLGIHRVAIEARLGQPLGSQPAHHTCANTGCVNPDHLMPVTHRDNLAEMLSRHAYIARIRELEDALAAVAPDHDLLHVLPLL